MWVNGQSPFWRLPRIQLFGEFSRARIELKIALAALRGVLANPDGSGRAYRVTSRQQRHCDCKAAGAGREQGSGIISGFSK